MDGEGEKRLRGVKGQEMTSSEKQPSEVPASKHRPRHKGRKGEEGGSRRDLIKGVEGAASVGEGRHSRGAVAAGRHMQ